MPHPEFFAGVLAAGFTVCALFFLRYWKHTRDTLFLAFSVAFALLATQQVLSIFWGLPDEERSWIYVLRLLAFLAIIFAIAGKNLRR